MRLPDIEQLLLVVPAFIIGIAIHEASHAAAATFLGDPTPRQQGRLTLNPLRHLDPMGSILLLIYGFGWGKPVYVNPMHFRGNPIKGMALVAVAGPLSNVIMAGLFGLILRIDVGLPREVIPFVVVIIAVNVMLAVFNMIPLPPLDGFSILMGILPHPAAISIAPLARYGPAALLVLFLLPSLLRIDVLGPILGPPNAFLLNLIIGH